MATHSKDYDFSSIEPRWQSFWAENGAFRAEDASPKPKYYVLDMFPYPSGAGLHIGHPEGYTGTDILCRYKRAQGFNVLHPIGWDAFGLPAEQHAVKTGTHPATNTAANIDNFRRQIKALGFSYDWEREINTTDPHYFKWTQWIFLQLFERGLAYVDERPVWWCPALKTVLANEEVVDGKSERGNHPVERRALRQWVLKITAYAERLLADLKHVDWPDSTKRMQEAWIGRSEGAEVRFGLENTGLDDLVVFTTRPDTLFGATFMVLAPEHPYVDSLTSPEQRDAVEAYRKQAAAKSDLERTDLAKDKSGVFSGAFAVNPANGQRVPIWIADYVLMGYGTGAIMAVPAHDERDFEFATKYKIPVVQVIEPADHSGNGEGHPELPYVGDGNLVHSDGYSGLSWREAKQKITADLEARGKGKPTINYKLRDWLFSRQRYWGEPIPIAWVNRADYETIAASGQVMLPAEPVSYEADGTTHYAVPVPASTLPLELPEVESYLPSDSGESPLANATSWVDIWFNPATGASAPKTSDRPTDGTWFAARRETNTMPQWAGSCWYYLRYLDPKNSAAIASPEALQYWGAPDLYVGGAEHAVLHLLYARFWHKVLFDIGLLPFDEPFQKLFHQGIILGEDGEKMSKSRGNVVSPDTIIASHGADSLRLFLMFLGPLDAMKPWNPQGIEGVHRFLLKVWRELVDAEGAASTKVTDAAGSEPEELTTLLHATIKKVGEDIEALRFNTAISQMMIFANALQKSPAISRDSARAFVQLLAPFAPHIGEELWGILGGPPPVQATPWPNYEASLLETQTQKLVVQINGKRRGEITLSKDADEEAAMKAARELDNISGHLEAGTIRRVVYVRGRILNIVIA
ncbi:leucine--tRNA ligase [Synoicihabitans lomoniglobus]|uniref:Leucine--tRNA ligase n=1 Tax=Synoicihabitans lomoniglobus TaxID=2909285 RepID=A0AAF0CSB7_9BACT|nr:leucine--tRNA ligase [Opitutaceae bacterium LMO-M01]WED67136.1 leucine--tRNA ligase [Opitutaceae bacterium LMO-M01]